MNENNPAAKPLTGQHYWNADHVGGNLEIKQATGCINVDPRAGADPVRRSRHLRGIDTGSRQSPVMEARFPATSTDIK